MEHPEEREKKTLSLAVRDFLRVYIIKGDTQWPVCEWVNTWSTYNVTCKLPQHIGLSFSVPDIHIPSSPLSSLYGVVRIDVDMEIIHGVFRNKHFKLFSKTKSSHVIFFYTLIVFSSSINILLILSNVFSIFMPEACLQGCFREDLGSFQSSDMNLWWVNFQLVAGNE